MPAIEKLSTINAALIRTGHEPLNTADNSSAAWIVGSQGFDDYLPVVLSMRDWNFQTAIAELARAGGDPFSDAFNDQFGGTPIPLMPGYADVFALPADCLHLQNVWRTDLAALVMPLPYYGMPRNDVRAPQLDYRIIGNLIQTVAPAGATAKYVQQPSAPTAGYSALFAETLKLAVAATIAIGLDEDMTLGAALLKLAGLDENMLRMASTRQDQQEPRRSAFRSSMLERRHRRRGC